MICPNCRSDLQDGSIYCTNCGMKLDGVTLRGQYSTEYNGHAPSSGFGNPASSFRLEQEEDAIFNGQGVQTQAVFYDYENQNGEIGQKNGFDLNDASYNGFQGETGNHDFNEKSQFASLDNSFSWSGEPSEPARWPTEHGLQESPEKKGMSGRAIIAIIISCFLLFLVCGVLIADHFGVFRIPFLPHQQYKGTLGNGGTAEQGNQEGTGASAGEDEPAQVDNFGSAIETNAETGNPESGEMNQINQNSGFDRGALSIAVTDIEPSDLSDYYRINITGIESAPGIDGTSKENILGENDKIWKTEKNFILSQDENVIRLSFEKCSVKAIEIRAGNWSSAESYNSDARPTKLYLSVEGYDYPLSLTDSQTSHYIVLSYPIEAEELILKIDQISNSITGNVAITNMTVYGK